MQDPNPDYIKKHQSNKVELGSDEIWYLHPMQNRPKCHTHHKFVTLWLHKLISVWRHRRALRQAVSFHIHFVSCYVTITLPWRHNNVEDNCVRMVNMTNIIRVLLLCFFKSCFVENSYYAFIRFLIYEFFSYSILGIPWGFFVIFILL